VRDSAFANSTSDMGQAMEISLQEVGVNNSLTISNCTFSGHRSTDNNGLISENDAATLIILGAVGSALVGHSILLDRLTFVDNAPRAIVTEFFGAYNASTMTLRDSFISETHNSFPLSIGGAALKVMPAGPYASDNAISILNTTFLRNSHAEGSSSGIDIEFRYLPFVNNTVRIHDCLIQEQDGQAVYLLFVRNSTVDLQRNRFINNIRGPSLSILSAADIAPPPTSPPSNLQENSTNCLFTEYSHLGYNSIVDCEFVGNSGGTLLLSNGDTKIRHSQFVNNSSPSVGGGVLLLGLGSALHLNDSQLTRNRALRGAQLYSGSSGMFHASNLQLDMNADDSSNFQFAVPTAGNLSLSDVRPTCPPGYQFSNVTVAASPAACVAAFTTLLYSCAACAPGTYSMQSTVDMCLPCEYGASCKLGGATILQQDGFWGELISTGGSVPHVSFSPCPPQYCGQDPAGAIFDHCLGNRTGRLCGSCAMGFSQQLGTSACRLDTHCQDSWFWPLALLLATLYVIYFCLQSPVSDGSIGCLLLFYQMASQTLVGETEMDAVLGVADFKLKGGGGSGICPIRGLSTLGSVFLNYFIPMLLVGGVLIVAVLVAIKRRYQSLPATDTVLYVELRDRSLNHHPSAVPASDAPSTSKFRLASALAQLVLFTYSNLTSTTATLLHCVPLEGASPSARYLFISADTQCFTSWQVLLVFVLAALVALPLGLLLLGFRASKRDMQEATQSPQQPPLAASGVKDDPIAATDISWFHRQINSIWSSAAVSVVRTVLTSPYRMACRYWQSVMILQLLIFVLLSTFVTQQLTRSLVQSILSVLMLLLHTSHMPFAHHWVNIFQQGCLLALTLLCLLNLPAASFVAGALSPLPLPLQHVEDGSRVLQGVLLAVPAAVIACNWLLRQYRARFSKANTTPMVLDDEGDKSDQCSYQPPVNVNSSQEQIS
jgi:hypothetical protein